MCAYGDVCVHVGDVNMCVLMCDSMHVCTCVCIEKTSIFLAWIVLGGRLRKSTFDLSVNTESTGHGVGSMGSQI